jgi:hypothetical protein
MTRGIKAQLVGQRFGHLTVVEFVDVARNGTTRWLCRCDCGNTTIVRHGNLKSGSTKGCGCLRHVSRPRPLSPDRHRQFSEYALWIQMKARCNNPRHLYYHNYGGRGIQVCERWRKSFKDFYADVGPRPSRKHTLDRINNNGNYEPGNVRWATRTEQNRNRRDNRMMTLNGETYCMAEWAEKLGVDYAILHGRLYQGWSDERALTAPLRDQSSGHVIYVPLPKLE